MLSGKIAKKQADKTTIRGGEQCNSNNNNKTSSNSSRHRHRTVAWTKDRALWHGIPNCCCRDWGSDRGNGDASLLSCWHSECGRLARGVKWRTHTPAHTHSDSYPPTVVAAAAVAATGPLSLPQAHLFMQTLTRSRPSLSRLPPLPCA